MKHAVFSDKMPIFAVGKLNEQIINQKKNIMKKQFLLFAALFVISLAALAQSQKRYNLYAVGFYNQENLFDTCHDEGKNDYEYLPAKGWNGMKYSHKLHNMAKALADMGTDKLPNVGCAFIGMAEVENHKVLDALIDQAPLKSRGMKYCHIEGPDRRGIDCALLYNPALFTVKNVKLVPYVQEKAKDSTYYTRGFLTVRGELAGEDVAVIVCHWPSRFSGSFYRESGARQTKAVKDSLMRENKNIKVFVMGDMNDDPTNKSMHEVLRAKPEISQVGPDDMYNPWYNILAKEGKGTLFYNGNWNLFDQIVVTPNLLNKDAKHKDFSTLKYFAHQVFRRDYLIQQEGQYKGAPLRTQAGGRWLDGFSDHLPVVMYLVKEAK